MELRQLDIHIQKNEIAYLSFTILRKITMWIRLKHKAWNWKILRGKQEKYHNIGLGSDFANVEDIRDVGLIPGPGRSPGEGNNNPLQDSCLENLMDRGAWWAMVHRFTKSWTRLKWLCTHTSNFSVICCMIQGSYAESCSARSTPFSKYTVLFPLIYMVANDLLNTNWTIFTVEGLYLSDFIREIKNPKQGQQHLWERIYHMNNCLEGWLDSTGDCECQREGMVTGPAAVLVVLEHIQAQQIWWCMWPWEGENPVIKWRTPQAW